MKCGNGHANDGTAKVVNSPPLKVSFVPAQAPYASVTGGQWETIDQRALEPIGRDGVPNRALVSPRAAFRVAYLSGQPVDASLQSSREWSR